MKTAFSGDQVAHVWASQSQQSGRNPHGNFYFEGKTIYSYGRHFPIATIEGNDVLFTLRTYSNTTSKQVWVARRAVSHLNVIECYEVPTVYNNSSVKEYNKKGYLKTTHEHNLDRWKAEIKSLFIELGNKKIRDIQSRVTGINSHIEKLNIYCTYFNLKISDKELKGFIKQAASPELVQAAREATEKNNAAKERKLLQAEKAVEQWLPLWRNSDYEGLKNLPEKIKTLCNSYFNNRDAKTRLRYNASTARVETSKGIEIPVEIAKRAFIQLNGCMEGSCKDISIPVLSYEITETGSDYIKAGCHTIPKSDVWYIANLLNWTK